MPTESTPETFRGLHAVEIARIQALAELLDNGSEVLIDDDEWHAEARRMIEDLAAKP